MINPQFFSVYSLQPSKFVLLLEWKYSIIKFMVIRNYLIKFSPSLRVVFSTENYHLVIEKYSTGSVDLRIVTKNKIVQGFQCTWKFHITELIPFFLYRMNFFEFTDLLDLTKLVADHIFPHCRELRYDHCMLEFSHSHNYHKGSPLNKFEYFFSNFRLQWQVSSQGQFFKSSV